MAGKLRPAVVIVQAAGVSVFVAINLNPSHPPVILGVICIILIVMIV